jgi:hypothetical protein
MKDKKRDQTLNCEYPLILRNNISYARITRDELIDITGRAAIEAMLMLSAQQVAGTKHPGKKAGDRQVRTREKESAESK